MFSIETGMVARDILSSFKASGSRQALQILIPPALRCFGSGVAALGMVRYYEKKYAQTKCGVLRFGGGRILAGGDRDTCKTPPSCSHAMVRYREGFSVQIARCAGTTRQQVDLLLENYI